jgi:small subunit ribosomal protein S20
MPNIKQQKKRVGTAARERLENLRYRSTVKTLTRRLESAVADGDSDRIAATHKELQQWIDRASSRGALHRNAAARKKAQAARLVSSRWRFYAALPSVSSTRRGWLVVLESRSRPERGVQRRQASRAASSSSWE